MSTAACTSRGKVDFHHGEYVLLQCTGTQGEGTLNGRGYNTIGFEAAKLCGREVRITATDGQPLPWDRARHNPMQPGL